MNAESTAVTVTAEAGAGAVVLDGTARELVAASVAENTRRVYSAALRRLDADLSELFKRERESESGFR